MLRSAVILHLVCVPVFQAYETWHVVDVPRVVCPKQGDIAQESVIQIDYTPEFVTDRHHIFSFLRASKQQVDVTFSAKDSGMPPVDVVKETTLKLAALDGAASPCPCTGETEASLASNALIGAAYGSKCGAWDKDKCEELYGRPTGKFCCEAWCFVSANCSSGWESPIAPGKFFSYAACADEFVSGTGGDCPYPTPEEKKADPCNCIDDPYPLFTDEMKLHLPQSYGKTCDAHDFKSKTCNPEIGFYSASQVDQWCCKNWCYVSKECSSAVPSINKGAEKKLFWSEITCDNESPMILKLMAQCPYKRGSEGVEKPAASTKSVDELCKCKGVALPANFRSNLGITNEAYGKFCYPWDATKCEAYYPGADVTDAMWCCQSWCYVDPECPSANKDIRWSEGYVSMHACSIANEPEQKDTISSCKYSKDCDCTGSNDGLNSTWIARLGSDYGKVCAAHDTDCEAKWPGDSWGSDPRSGCCDSWCYVKDKCPLAEKSWTGASLFFNYDTCDDDKSLEYDATLGKCKDTDTAKVVTTADPLCSKGVLESEVCCAGSCAVCGGEECGVQIGGPDMCCTGRIKATSVSCDTDGAPCIVSDPAKASAAKNAASNADPTCANGVKKDEVCCAPTCEACGGEECGTSTGGPDNCCQGRIRAAAVSCETAGPPCIVGSRLLSSASEERTKSDSDGFESEDKDFEDEVSIEADTDDEGLSSPDYRKLSARRRAGGGSSFSSSRRRSPPPNPRRRSPPPNPRRRAPTKPSGSDVRRRAPAPKPPPPPTPSGAPALSSARRRAPTPPPGKAAPVATDARRRATGDIGGTRYNTQTSNAGGKQTGYGYTNKNQMQSNYGGNMPKRSNYGYSGANAVQKNSKVKMAMAAAAGVAVGVGGYYMYNQYKDYKERKSFCEHSGEFYSCDYCRRRWGIEGCREEQNCFSGGGCSYTVPDDISRDDLMKTGFLPKFFTPPIMVKISKIVGEGMTQQDLKCDPASLEMMAKNVSEVQPMMFKPSMWLTLTSMDALDDPPSPPPAPGGGGFSPADSPNAAQEADTGHGVHYHPGLLVLLLAVSLGGVKWLRVQMD